MRKRTAKPNRFRVRQYGLIACAAADGDASAAVWLLERMNSGGGLAGALRVMAEAAIERSAATVH